MEPEPGSVRETDSTATFVHDAQQDTIADEPIPTQCLTTTDLLLLLLRTSQTPPPETGSPLRNFIRRSCEKTELLHGSLGRTKSALHPEMGKAISIALKGIFFLSK